MKETDNNNDDSSSGSDSVDSNATVSRGVTTKVKAKPIAVFVKQGRTGEHPATIVDPIVLQQIKERGPTGWRLTDIPDNEYIMIEWSTGGRKPVISTSVVLQNEDDYGYIRLGGDRGNDDGDGGADSTYRNRRSRRTHTTGGGGGVGTNAASASTQSGRGVGADAASACTRTRRGGGSRGGTNSLSANTRSRRGGGGTNAASTRTQSRRGGGGVGGTNTARRGGRRGDGDDNDNTPISSNISGSNRQRKGRSKRDSNKGSTNKLNALNKTNQKSRSVRTLQSIAESESESEYENSDKASSSSGGSVTSGDDDLDDEFEDILNKRKRNKNGGKKRVTRPKQSPHADPTLLIDTNIGGDMLRTKIGDLSSSAYQLMLRLSCDIRKGKPAWASGDALYHLYRKTTLKTNSSYDDVLSFVVVELGKLQLELNEYSGSSLFYDTKMKSRPPDQNDDMINDKTTSISPITTTYEFQKALVLGGNNYVQQIDNTNDVDQSDIESDDDESSRMEARRQTTTFTMLDVLVRCKESQESKNNKKKKKAVTTDIEQVCVSIINIASKTEDTNEYFLYGDKKEYESLTYDYDALGTTVRVGHLRNAIYTEMSRAGDGDLVGAKSSLYLQTNFKKKYVGNIDKVLRSCTLSVLIEKLAKNPTVANNHTKTIDGKKTMNVFMCLGKRASADTDFDTTAIAPSQSSTVSMLSPDTFNTKQKSQREERSASRSASVVALWIFDLYWTHPNSQYRSKLTSEMQSIIKMRWQTKTAKRDKEVSKIEEAIAHNSLPHTFPSLNWMNNWEELKGKIRPGDQVWEPVPSSIEYDDERDLPEEFQGKEPPRGIQKEKRGTNIELAMQQQQGIAKEFVAVIKESSTTAQCINFIRNDVTCSLNKSALNGCNTGRDIYTVASNNDDTGVFSFTLTERNQITVNKTHDLIFKLNAQTFNRKRFFLLPKTDILIGNKTTVEITISIVQKLNANDNNNDARMGLVFDDNE